MIDRAVNEIALQMRTEGRQYASVYAIPRGGLVLGVMMSHTLKVPLLLDEKEISIDTLVCDDIVDTGKTMDSLWERIHKQNAENFHVATIYATTGAPLPTYHMYWKQPNDWIHFPWENYQKTLEVISNARTI